MKLTGGRAARMLLFLLLLLALAACDRPTAPPEANGAPPAGEPQVVEAPAETAPAEDQPVAALGNADAAAASDATNDESAANDAAANDAAANDAAANDAAANDAAANDGVANESAAPTAEPTVAPTATPNPAQGRVVLWHSYAGADGDALAAGLVQLAQTYPELTVETLFVAYDDLPQAYADAVLAGGGPDLIAAPTWWLTQMVDAGVVQPLDALIDPALTAQYFPAALDNLTRNDVLYGFPLTYELVSLYVNTQLIDPAALPATAADLLALAEAGATTGSGIYANLYHLAWGLPAFGARLMDESGAAVLDQGPGAADFLAWLKELDETESAYVDQDYGMLLDRFKKGEFAFFVDGPWAAAELSAALGDALSMTLLPAGPAGPAQPWLSADGVLLNPNKDTAQQQRALLVAAGLTDRASGAQWAQIAQRLPANRDAPVGDDPLLQGFMQQAAGAQAMPHQPQMDAVWGYAGDMFIKVLNNVMSPTDAATETSALINEANGK